MTDNPAGAFGQSAPRTFTVYAHGPAYASVCTNLEDTLATERINAVHPTGIDSVWRIADEPFASGEPNPSPCPQAPSTHRHLLFSC